MPGICPIVGWTEAAATQTAKYMLAAWTLANRRKTEPKSSVADVAKEHRIAMTDEQHKLFGIDKLNVPRSAIPAVTHVDYSARVQTVHRETNPKYHELISRFKGLTGCPVIVNTSFNVRGEPIVGSPEDAFRCFMGSEIETLAVGNCFLVKDRQNPALKLNYENAFELD